MPTEPKLRRLREMRTLLVAGKLTDTQRKQLRIADTDGRIVRLWDEDALEVIDRRIAAEESNADA